MNDADTFQIEPPARRSSGKGKLLAGIGIGCVVAGLLCCGLVVGAGWWAVELVAQMISVDPAAIRDKTQQIASLEVPARFEPEMMLHIDPPFLDEIGSMVVYENKADNESLLLGEYRDLDVANRPPSDVFRDIDTNVSISINGQKRQIDVQEDERRADFEETSREPLERPMRGGTARFEIVQGKEKGTGRERIIAYGTFPGHRGGGIFRMSVDAANSSVEDVKRIIETLR
jgi:hypothetical protein